MATEDTESSLTVGPAAAATSATSGAAAAAASAPRSLHARSFKLRFAAQREQGRSYVSLVKPLGLPATVTGKFYAREEGGGGCGGGGGGGGDAEERAALERIRGMFVQGPRDRLAAPLTSSQVIGWYVSEASEASEAGAVLRSDRRLNHHIRDSAWLKARLCVLAADDKLKQR